MAYILPSLSLPTSMPSLPTREQLRRAWARTVTIVCWAVAITFTAGRLSRKLWESVRPGLARMLHALALLLDPQLPSYPDQPEPDPTPEPRRPGLAELVASLEDVRVQASRLPEPAPAPAKPGPTRVIDLNDCVTPAKPRPARRSRAKAPAKEAA